MSGSPVPTDRGDTPGLQPVQVPLDRRAFLVWAAGVSLGATGVFIGATVIQAMVPPERSIDGRTNLGRIRVARISELKLYDPIRAEYGEERIFVVKVSGTEVLVFDAACPHVGCELKFDALAGEFVCPCHASAFTVEGKRLRGPAPRDMVARVAETVNGEVIVSGSRV